MKGCYMRLCVFIMRKLEKLTVFPFDSAQGTAFDSTQCTPSTPARGTVFKYSCSRKTTEKKLLRLALTSIVVCMAALTSAQDTINCKVVFDKNSPQRILLNGVIYDLYDSTALTRIVNLQIINDSLKSEITAKDKLIATLNTIPEKCTTAVAAKNEYIASLTDMMQGYKQLYQDAAKLNNSALPKVTFEGAVGISGADGINLGGMSKPVLLAGIGVKKFRTYLMLQEMNVGFMVGGSWGLF